MSKGKKREREIRITGKVVEGWLRGEGGREREGMEDEKKKK